MSERVDKLEKDVAYLKRLGWATLLVTLLGLAARLVQIYHETTAPRGVAPSGNSNAVHIGSAGPVEESRKTYLTTAGVAARENVAERTVIEWIEQGRIAPAPVKAARSWTISADYRILPQLTAENRTP